MCLALLTCTSLYGQAVESKKCKTCGKPLKECQYRGKHPQSTSASTQQTPTHTSQSAAKEGSIYITSTPSGAAVKVDGKNKGETPLTIEKLSPGSHTVIVSHDGYESYTQTVTITAGKTANCHASLKKEQTKIESKYVRMDGDDIVFDLNGTEYRYRMVYVSGGSYTMGCKDEYDDDNRPNCEKEFERPAHNVTVDGFYIGQTEVTYALWCAVMRRIPDHYPKDWSSSYYSSNDFNLPVSFVSYNDCKEFIGKLNSLTGKVFRLPTENEWEYAARGGVYSHNYRYSGSDNRCSVTSCNGKVLPVAQKQSNELGLYDMSGNVSEWCDDLFRYYSGSELDPRCLPSIPCYVIRGGSCDFSNQYTHVSIRTYEGPDYYYWDIGFRLAR